MSWCDCSSRGCRRCGAGVVRAVRVAWMKKAMTPTRHGLRATAWRGRWSPAPPGGRVGVAVSVLAVAIVALLVLAVLALVAFFRSDAGSLPTLLNKLADIVTNVRASLPPAIADYLPESVEEIKAHLSVWLQAHATQLTGF